MSEHAYLSCAEEPYRYNAGFNCCPECARIALDRHDEMIIELAAQRKVLEQALEALKHNGAGNMRYGMEAITAIQGVLK